MSDLYSKIEAAQKEVCVYSVLRRFDKPVERSCDSSRNIVIRCTGKTF
jgi:hypothetical protein